VDAAVGGEPALGARWLGRSVELDLGALRWPGAAMLAAGAALPMLGHPGVGCPLRTITGIPCPLCGMSTSVEDSLRLQIVDALKANPVGLLAVAVAVFALLVRRDLKLRIPIYLVYAGLLSMWLFELIRFGV
jgi:hypothetical protein